MSGFRGIQMSLFVVLLHLTVATGQRVLSLIFKEGSEVTLPCESVERDQSTCDDTLWFADYSYKGNSITLVRKGQIQKNLLYKSRRLSVTENCSLVIKKVTAEDVGRYTCRQFDESGRQQGPDSLVDLSVVILTEDRNDDEVKLLCDVAYYGKCRHKVDWQLEGVDDKNIATTLSYCFVTASFSTSHFTDTYDRLKCKVADEDTGKEQLFSFFSFCSRYSGGKPVLLIGEDAATSGASLMNSTTQEHEIQSGLSRTDCFALNYIMLAMRAAELVLITVVTVLLVRARGNQRPPDDNTVLNSGRSRTAKRSGPAASQVSNDEDEDDGTVNYENSGDPSSSVRLR